ncbi:MAG TPA: DoxX-like family protein, partial [Burkholderiaceae bacterium]
MKPDKFPASLDRHHTKLVRLYWAMRFGIACLWLWTAVTSWFLFPQEQSLDWLRRLGLTSHTHLLFAGACLLDMAMGIASAIFASRRVWQAQILIIAFYTAAIAIGLPEF